MTKVKEYEGMSAKERTKLLADKLADLMKNIIRSPEKLKQFAQSWRTGFHTYSFRNNLLILIQKPTATVCAGRGAWKKKKREVIASETYQAQWVLAPQIKKEKVMVYERDENGNRIPKSDEGNEGWKMEQVERDRLVCFFSVPVYDISQTEGEPLDIGMNSSKFEGKEFTVESMAKCFPKYDIRMVELLPDGKAYHDSNRISVAKRKNKAQEVSSLFHEIAHHELGHTDTKGRKARFEGLLNSEIREIVELEAQATSFLVCSCVGIDELEGSADYIATWKGNAEKIGRSAEKVMSTADRMIKQIAKCLQVKS